MIIFSKQFLIRNNKKKLHVNPSKQDRVRMQAICFRKKSNSAFIFWFTFVASKQICNFNRINFNY